MYQRKLWPCTFNKGPERAFKHFNILHTVKRNAEGPHYLYPQFSVTIVNSGKKAERRPWTSGETCRLRRAIKLSNPLSPTFLSSPEKHVLRLHRHILPGKLDNNIRRNISYTKAPLALLLNSFPGGKDDCATALKLTRGLHSFLQKKSKSIKHNISAL